jgi:adenylate cyclase, class 2
MFSVANHRERNLLMPTEYEAKILDIDPKKVAESILARGGRRIGDTVLLRRYVYDIIPGDSRRWIRLRDTGRGSTLAVKEIRHQGIDGTDETEAGVENFEVVAELLTKLGFAPRNYQENRRTSFAIQGARLEIDEWPLIPPYLEIEADSRAEVLRVAGLLGYREAELTAENTVDVYSRYDIDLLALPRVSFSKT